MNPGMRDRLVEYAWAAAWWTATVLAAASLAGCAHTSPVTPARTAIPVECREPIPQRPAMPTDSLKTCEADPMCVDNAVRALTAEIELRRGYEHQLERALAACTTPINHPRSTP